MNSLKARVAEFLGTPPPATLIIVGESVTKGILTRFGRDGTLKTNQEQHLLLDACIASNAVAASEAEHEEEKRHFAATSCLLSEIKTEIGSR